MHHIIDDLFFTHFCSILDLDFNLKGASFCLNHIFSTCVLSKVIILFTNDFLFSMRKCI